MALLGKAAIAMWWDIAPAWRAQFEDWHSHEHFPERMNVPGFLRGSRWISARGGEGFFVMYELDAYETLSSSAYLNRLNSPTPWSTTLMPQHRNMIRSQCHVLESAGGGLARYALTIRLTPRPGADADVRAYLKAHAASISMQAGISGGHLLMTQTPSIASTTEQKIRGGMDQTADWIYVINGYEIGAVAACEGDVLNAGELRIQCAAEATWSDIYCLSHASESA